MISGQKFQIRAAFVFLLTLASANAQQNVPLEKPKDRSEPVVLMVTALNEKGHDISGLQQSNFLVLEDKVAQTISSFSSRDEPISVGIVLDASGSMRGDPPASSKRKRQLLTEALARFLELSNASNEYFVMGISSRPWLLLDWTSDRHVVIERVSSLEAKGITALYDACYPAIERVRQGRYAKGVVLLISDGQDNNSLYKFSEVRELLKESNVLFYAVDVLEGVDYSTLGIEGEKVLGELSSVSGGDAFFPRLGAGSKPNELPAVFEQIARELRNQYKITFLPAPATGKKKWHKIKVKVSPPTNASREMKHLSVRVRKGYYQY